MVTTCRFVEEAYAALDRAARRGGARARARRARCSSTWCRPSRSRTSPTTLRALLASRYPHGQPARVVATREEEEQRAPPGDAGHDGGAGAALPRRAAALAAEDAVARGGPRAKAARRISSTGRSVPRRCGPLLGETYDPARVWVGVSDADSHPRRATSTAGSPATFWAARADASPTRG